MGKMELPKAYDFKSTEGRIYEWWEKQGYFQPVNDPNKAGFEPNRKPYVISIPPPNITGELHLGSALFVSLEDLMIRYHRMKGIPTLWVPGSDHASIATQSANRESLANGMVLPGSRLVESNSSSVPGLWKEKYGGIITNQIGD